jgi:hypothetical protein
VISTGLSWAHHRLLHDLAESPDRLPDHEVHVELCDAQEGAGPGSDPDSVVQLLPVGGAQVAVCQHLCGQIPDTQGSVGCFNRKTGQISACYSIIVTDPSLHSTG